MEGTIMSTLEQSQLDREDKPINAIEVSTEVDNVIFIVGGKLGLEAIGNKILILIDKFKSGYECKDCNETGLFNSCACTKLGSFGVKENGRTCHFKEACERQVVGSTCRTCNGTGTTIKIPDNAKAIPTSGVIVSIGPEVTLRKIGERVLFGAHTGYFLPFKGNAKIRCMREDEPLCLIFSLDTKQQLGEFLQIDESAKED
jgi:co-chaperonin GroES (HSP10)